MHCEHVDEILCARSLKIQAQILALFQPDQTPLSKMNPDLNDRFASEDWVDFEFTNVIQEYSLSQFLIRQLVGFAGKRNFAPSGMKVLDYGCDPHPIYASSLSFVAKDIVLAEFDESHRQFLEDWQTEKPGTHDWSFYFQYIRDRHKKRNLVDSEVMEEDVKKRFLLLHAMSNMSLSLRSMKVHTTLILSFFML